MKSRFSTAGFTLIEVIIVIAISGSLLLLALAGRSRMIQQSRFDTAIQEMIQQLEYTRNYAVAGVNPDGTGKNRRSEVIGVAFEIDEHHPEGKLFELEPIYRNYNAAGNVIDSITDMPVAGSCPHATDGECYEVYFNNSVKLHVANSSTDKAQAVFLKTPDGVITCGWTGGEWIGYAGECDPASNPDFGSPVFFEMKDDFGNNAKVRIDPNTGLATRVD